ncbi:hypothetical protein B0H14DRAFT_489997 [Mycena olivaceomarginata]|nr:hypothetical protein B0H14DRAFT_489997 [Mycena olivaceomarginata]
MSAPSFGDCDKDATDTQLFIDNQAGLINSTFKLECYAGPDGRTIVQKGPAFSLCGLFAGDPNLCIGGNKGQHACGGPKCQVIDWTKARAPGCPSAILEHVQVQPAGIVAPCCTSDGCSTPSDPQDAPYTCDISQTLYLCVNDGVGAECVDPKAKTICSGNFSGAGVPSGTSGQGGSQTASSGNGTGTASHPLLYLSHNWDLRRWLRGACNFGINFGVDEKEKNTSASPCDGSGCSSDDRAERGAHV